MEYNVILIKQEVTIYMKRYRDIDEKARHADPELQLLLNEATLGRNLAELAQNGLRADSQTATAPVLVDGNIIFRVAVFEKGSMDERDALVELAQGNTYSEQCLIIPGDSSYLEVFKAKSFAKKETVED